MRILTQLLTGLVFLAVGALILLHFVPGSAGMATRIFLIERMAIVLLC